MLGRTDRWLASCHNHGNPETNQLGGEVGESIVPPFRPSGLQDEVLALNPAQGM